MRKIISILCFLLTFSLFSQITNTKPSFFERVQFGGTGALNFSNNFTTISLAPQAVYPVNPYFSTGLGLQYSYLESRNNYKSQVYGGSWISLFQPIEEFQFSTELEQLRVNTELDNGLEDEFWNTALFLGLGYTQENFTFGLRYNVLFKESNTIYPQAWMPFVRVFF